MSMYPFLIDYDIERPRRLMDQHFGMGLTPEDLMRATVSGSLMGQDYYRPWRHFPATRDSGSNIRHDREKFQVNLDIQHFFPEEITVKTVDGYVVVEGKHEEKKDQHGYISRQFIRRYELPKACEPDKVECKLSSDGVLTVTAPKSIPEAVQGERSVPISHTGPVRKDVFEQAIEDGE